MILSALHALAREIRLFIEWCGKPAEEEQMAEPLRLLCVLAHPDDESMGTGGILARYQAEGVETYLVTATRGEYGWQNAHEPNPGPEALGALREKELLAAAQVLGLREVNFLDYIDGFLDQANPVEVIAKIAAHIRRIQPHVVVTFGSDGSYGHPDHIAISQFTAAAVVRAADPSFVDSNPPYSVCKLYYMVVTQHLADLYRQGFGDIVMPVDDVPRTVVIWPDWAVTTCVDNSAYSATVWQAIACHRSQLPNYDRLKEFPESYHQEIWRRESFYRVFSLVNGGRTVERDLFEGLRS
jgi:LmbE family N-acetylglucosaminyl deacetylase